MKAHAKCNDWYFHVINLKKKKKTWSYWLGYTKCSVKVSFKRHCTSQRWCVFGEIWPQFFRRIYSSVLSMFIFSSSFVVVDVFSLVGFFLAHTNHLNICIYNEHIHANDVFSFDCCWLLKCFYILFDSLMPLKARRLLKNNSDQI